MLSTNKINITAHAGCMNTEMDSIESLEAGIKYGADVLEVDANIDEKGNLIVSHDIPLANKRYISFYSVLEIIHKEQNLLLNVDIKNIQVLRELRRAILNYNLEDRIFFTGLNYLQIIENKDQLFGNKYFINLEAPKLDITKLENSEYLDELLSELIKLGIIGVNLNYKFATSEMIKVCKKHKLLTSVWTIEDIEEMKTVIKLQVNSITTKHIDQLKCLLKEKEVEVV